MGLSERQGIIAFLVSAFVILFVVPAPLLLSAGEKSTYDIVISGRSCGGTRPREITCEYRVGKDLHFTIDGIGGAWTDITFIRSDYHGDFFGSYGLGHGCVIVKRGTKNWNDQYCGGPGSPVDFAFVSTKTGNVHRSWESCMEER